MINVLRKMFIKDYKNINDKDVRFSHGILASFVGIITNLIVFLIKIIFGILSFSVSIISDAINNLSDMASSIVSLIGFKLSKKSPDKEHPYGHERIEYISGLIISIIIIIVGGFLVLTSIYKIIDFKGVEFDNSLVIINIIILSIAILIKIYQAYFYYKISKLISSLTLKANFRDSINDVLVTTLVLLALVFEYILYLNNVTLPFSLDGVLGILVSIFIIITGISLLKEETSPLIGEKINKEYVIALVDEIEKYDEILNYHDIMCHTYGEAKCYMTIHLEVDKNNTLEHIHSIIDEIETNIKMKYGIELTIHVDPVDLDNKEIVDVKNKFKEFANKNNYDISIHDIRIIKKGNKDLLLFDVLIPFDYDDNIIKEINSLYDDKYELRINIDHPFY